MNKNLYRIVFSKARGMLVVVAEITRSCRAVACPSSGAAGVQRQCITRLNALAFGLLLALGAVQPAMANVVADKSAPGNQQPTIISSANGTTQVNIQTPSQGGVSRNVYSQFDVDNKGVILNNSRGNASTQIGGMVAPNPWLTRGEASIILNEVNSRDPSRLNGYVEVAGKKAQVVIANPSGITCDGCGFINASRATLTTGQVQMNNGNLTGYDVSKGDIVIQGKGMDTSRQDYTDIIARSVKVNAGLWASDLKVTAGAGTVDAAHQNVVAKSGDDKTRPQLAVDVASLGGMYAGKIRLTGTEAGVGVRNAGNIGAQAGTVVVTADGRIDNSGNLSGNDVGLNARSIVNRGTIDGTRAHIETDTLSNQGTGRIYGDRIAIKANTLDNAAENGVAATLAARDRLDIAAGTLNNTGHGLIYSAGAMTINGGELTNRGATIESGGDMRLDMNTVHNLNNRLVTEIVVAEVSNRHEAVLSGRTQRYDWSQVNTSQKNKYGVHTARMPDGSSDENFYEYNYTRTIQETRVIESDPGKILSGGNLTLNSDQMNNRDSQIIAAKVLDGSIPQLNNDATTGVKIITDVGGQTRWYAKKKKKKVGGTKTTQGQDYDGYRPAPVTQTLSLHTLAWEGDNQARSSSVLPAVVPASSFYRVHPDSTSHYLVETDPRFTNERTWLGSDYMQNALSPNGDTVLKRLGDGFYEQQLIRNQVTGLTGQRYLNGFDDDNAQYKSLMDAGIAFAREHKLTTGVALSAEQMALLTSDMVWMVEQNVQLADGSSQRVLVPQVYVRVKAGDVDGNGSLLAGNRVALQTAGDLNNSGTIAGRESAAITANNVNNSGLIRGGTLDIAAATDVNNTGGTLLADDALQVTAGRNLNSTSTLSGDESNHGLDRTAGIYVQNDNGKMVLQGVNDINLNATLVGNNGKASTTVLAAGNNINLGTITTTHSERGDWGGDNYRDLTQRSDVGSQITGNGSVQLSAGKDLNARAASINAADALSAVAGNDINIVAGESAYHLTEHSRQTSKGFLSGISQETHEEHEATKATASNVSGDRVTLLAGNDLRVRGSAVVADGDIALKGGGDVTIDAATERASDYSMKKTSKSGILGNGLGITIGSQSAQETRNGAQVTQSDSRSMIGTTAGNIIIEAGDKATLVAANMVAGRDAQDTTRKTGHIDVKASDIDIVAGKDVVTGSVEQKSKSSGVGITLSNPIIDTVRNIRDIAKTSGGSNITRAKTIASEAGASVLDISSEGMSLPVSYGKSSSKSEMHYAGEYAVGSSLSSGGNVQLNATGNKGNGDVLIHGSNIGAKEAAIIDAQGNVDITASTDKQVTSSESSSKNWSITTAAPSIGSAIRTVSGGPNNGSSILPFGYGKSDSKESSETTAQTGSQITAEDVYINSKDGHVNVSGSSLAAINDLMLTAKNGDITVDTGNNHVVKETSGSQTQIGPLGGDGYSGTVGWSRDKYASQLDQNQQSTLRSQIASRDGDVTLAAGNDVAIDGADISAGKSVNISGENVRLDVSEDRLKSHSESSNTQYGVKASASGWVVSAAQAVENAARSVEENRDPRLSAIYAAQAGLNIASQTMQSDMNPSAVKVTVSATAGSSKQKQDYSSQQQQGTTIQAGDAVNISADKDITGAGVNIAGKNVNLDAGRDIILATARDKEALKNTASGNQFSAGVGFGLGGSQNGFSIELGASTYSNKENGDGLVHHNSQIVADETLTVNSGRDTTLKGTELKGDRVAVDVGRNLTIASQQDEQNYESKNKSGGVNVSICVPPICAGSTVSGTANAAGGKIANEYKSVIDQSGIYAGQGGFDVHVGEHTQLDGAVIASDATADKNRLDTGTLGWTDIENKAKSGGSQYAVSVSGGVGQNEDGSLKPIASGLPTSSLASVSDSDSSTTRSAVADGEIIIRDKDNQQQDITGLSRDTANAHQALDNNFDKDKIRDRLETQTQAVALGTQAMDAWRTSKLSDEKAKIRAEMDANGELKGLSDEQINAKIEHSEQYKKVDEKYGVGSEFWRNGTAITGLLAGVLGGNVTGGMAAGAAPYVAGLIKDAAGDNNAARIALHTLASAVLVKAQGGNSAAGAAGGFIAAAASDKLASALFNKKVDALTPEEKTVISNLVTALGAAGGSVAGGGSQGIGGGANAARVEVENNFLAVDMYTLDREVKAAKEKGEDLEPIFEAARKKAEAEREAQITACKANPDICGFGRDIANDAYNEYLQNGFLLGIDPDVANFVQKETAKDSAVVDQYTSEFGKDLVVAAEGLSILAGMGTGAALNVLKTGGTVKNTATGATVTVYRVEGAPNTRVLIGDQGQVTIVGQTTLYLNFGDKARAQEFLQKRNLQNMDGATVKSFDVPKSVLDDLRKNAVSESEVKFYPNKPIVADPTKAPDQYGIRPHQIKDLQDKIIQGTGKDANKR